MKTMTKAFFSLTLLLGACDKEETAEPEQDLVAAEGHHRGGWMKKLDVDGDGAVSREEAKGHRLEARFAEIDADGDGKLTREELKAMKGKHGRGHGPGGWGAKDPAERAAKVLAKFDANSDGSLTPDEVAGHHLADRFAEVDGDGDGKLVREELAAMKGPQGKHGGGHGGKRGDKHGGGHGKDPAEHAARKLAKFDANGDGSLTRDEVDGHHLTDKFAEIDGDGDGKLTREELTAFKAAHHGEGRGGPHHGEGRGGPHRGE